MNGSIQNRSVTKEDLNDVIQLVQSTMQALTTFEKAIYRTQRHRNDPLNNVVNSSKKTLPYNKFKLLKMAKTFV